MLYNIDEIHKPKHKGFEVKQTPKGRKIFEGLTLGRCEPLGSVRHCRCRCEGLAAAKSSKVA